jgi:uncharacterized protein involved in type VI secretion and phage assembly
MGIVPGGFTRLLRESGLTAFHFRSANHHIVHRCASNERLPVSDKRHFGLCP